MNASQQRQLIDFMSRRHLATFIHRTFQTVSPGERYIPNWHIEAMAWHLGECLAGRIKRLVITMPPRYLKSICASVAFPAWALGRNPSKRVVCVSYAADLAVKHSRDCRQVMESDWYRSVFPLAHLAKDKNSQHEFETIAHGPRYSTSIGGAITGRGGNIVIIDDPINTTDAMSKAARDAAKDWYDRTLPMRLNSAFVRQLSEPTWA